jgi:hypothetical protein
MKMRFELDCCVELDWRRMPLGERDGVRGWVVEGNSADWKGGWQVAAVSGSYRQWKKIFAECGGNGCGMFMPCLEAFSFLNLSAECSC